MKYDFLRYHQDSRHYSLGLKLFELGSIIFSSFSLRRIASTHLDQLQARLGKTVFLGILESDELIYIDKKEDPKIPIRFTSQIGTRRPPHFGMLGQILLAFLPDQEVNRLLRKAPLTLFTKRYFCEFGNKDFLLTRKRRWMESAEYLRRSVTTPVRSSLEWVSVLSHRPRTLRAKR
jgi:DNA-binding IclR family transcriptional regulator